MFSDTATVFATIVACRSFVRLGSYRLQQEYVSFALFRIRHLLMSLLPRPRPGLPSTAPESTTFQFKNDSSKPDNSFPTTFGESTQASTAKSRKDAAIGLPGCRCRCSCGKPAPERGLSDTEEKLPEGDLEAQTHGL